MSQQRPIFPNGIKLVIEELEALSQVAGHADDNAIAALSRVPIETTSRLGYVRPWRDGPLLVSDGATGKVKVRPFWAYRSPAGASAGGGTEDATPGASESLESLVGGFFAGTSISVPTPVPSAGNLRWDLLYAIIGLVDTATASRLVKNTTSKVTAIQSILSRNKVAITLAWVQGTVSPVATDPYPLGNLPALPAPATGMAHAPLGYVQVRNAATPATEVYGIDRIANAPKLLRQNPRAGAIVSSMRAVAGKKTVTGGQATTPEQLIALASAQGGWANSGANVRPARFVEAQSGGVRLWIPFGPFSNTVGNRTFGTLFTSSPLLPLGGPDDGGDLQIDWRNRVFNGEIIMSASTNGFGHDVSGSTATAFQPMTSVSGAEQTKSGWGQTHRGEAAFDALMGLSLYTVACFFKSVSGTPGDDVAVICEKSTGKLYVICREATTGYFNGGTGFIKLDASDRFATG